MTTDVVRSGGVGLVEQYRHQLGRDDVIDQYSNLIPADDRAALRREIEASLQPASRTEVAEVAAVLFASFKIGDVLEDREAFAAAMIKQLARYPAEVLEQMIGRAQRQFAWLPSIAEVVAICDELVDNRRQPLRALDRMDAEHRRRQEESRRIAEQQRRDREWVAKLETRAAEVHGDTAPRSGDIEVACRLRPVPRRCGHFVTWEHALETLWGVTLCCRLAELALLQQSEPAPDLDAAIAALEETTWREYSETRSP